MAILHVPVFNIQIYQLNINENGQNYSLLTFFHVLSSALYTGTCQEKLFQQKHNITANNDKTSPYTFY